jgi:hypothetical protein
MSAASNCYIDGEALIRAKRRSHKAFEQLVAHYRSLGATDARIVTAMARAPGLISTLHLAGGRR